MRARRFPLACLAGLVALAAAIATPVGAKEPVLGRYVPAGVHFYGEWAATEAGYRLSRPAMEAFAKLVDSGIGEDILELATLELGPDMRAAVRAQVDRCLKLLKLPDWSALASREMAFAFRISVPFPEYLVLFGVEEGTAASRLGELRQLLEGVAGFAPDVLSVDEAELSGATAVRLGARDVPIALTVASKKGVIAISTSDVLLDSSLRLLDDAAGGGSFVDTERFREAQAGRPDDAIGMSFFDLEGYLGFIRGMMGMAQGAVQGNPEAAAVFSLVHRAFDELSRLESISSTERIDGSRYQIDGRLSLAQQGGGPGVIEELIRAQEPIRQFHRVVPRDALSFHISSGIDPETVYDGALTLIEEHFPSAAPLVEMWTALQNEIGFNLKNDLLAWIDGGGGCIALPSRTGVGSEYVAFLRLKDRDKAKTFIKKATEKLRGFLASRGQEMRLVPIPEAGDFQRLEIAALPWCRPVIGLPGDALVLASSEDAGRRVVETFRGKAPSIKDSPRFAALHLPESPLCDVYYYDVEGSLTAFANLLGTVGFALSLAPEERDTRPAIKVGAILTKLAAFLRDSDVAVYTVGWSSYDPETHTVKGRKLTTYRTAK